MLEVTNKQLEKARETTSLTINFVRKMFHTGLSTDTIIATVLILDAE